MNLALLTLAALPLPPIDTPTWPLQPRPEIVRGFDLPAKPWLPGHRGVDLAGRPGQPVRAAVAGTITYAGSLAGRGVVTITTGPRRTTYEPVVPEFAPGATVAPGTVIGRLSAAGSHCSPSACLHWGLIEGEHYLNPLTLLPNRPIRLLPLTDQFPPATASPPQTTAPLAPPLAPPLTTAFPVANARQSAAAHPSRTSHPTNHGPAAAQVRATVRDAPHPVARSPRGTSASPGGTSVGNGRAGTPAVAGAAMLTLATALLLRRG
jgi:hypothetical protein